MGGQINCQQIALFCLHCFSEPSLQTPHVSMGLGHFWIRRQHCSKMLFGFTVLMIGLQQRNQVAASTSQSWFQLERSHVIPLGSRQVAKPLPHKTKTAVSSSRPWLPC